jgi:hypothetical protein
MNEQEKQIGSQSHQNERQPYRLRLPGFILDKDIGLGDAIQRVTYAVGIRPTSGCGCERRAEVLNRQMVFSPRRSR